MKNHDIHRRRRTCLRITATTVFVLAGCHLSTVEALSLVYDQPTGFWREAANWQNATRRVPTVDDTAFIRAGRVVTVDSAVGTAGTVYLGDNGAQGSLIVTTGGSLTVANGLQVMRNAAFSDVVGTLTMNGGTLSADVMTVGSGGANLGASMGTATISGGTLTAPITVGSTASAQGFFNIVGSSAAISGSSFTVNTLGRMNFTFGSSGVSMLNYATGTASFASGSTFTISGSSYTGGAGDITLVDSANLTWNVQPGDVNITGFSGFTTQLLTANNDVILRLTAVPESSSALLLCAGAPLLAWRQRRRA